MSSFGPRGLFNISADGYQERVITYGSGSPEGVVSGDPNALYIDTATGTQYRKATGFGTTGWTSAVAHGDITCTTLTATGTVNAGAASSLGFTGRAQWKSSADGFLEAFANNGSTTATVKTGPLLYKSNILGKSSAYPVVAADSGSTLAAIGATPVAFTLPATATGLTYTFVNGNGATEMSITAVGADVIHMQGATSSAAGSITTTAVGQFVTLICVVSGHWFQSSGTNSATWTIT